MSTLAERVRVPGLVLVLGFGMLVGSDGLGWISFSDSGLARRLDNIALALIVFEGGIVLALTDPVIEHLNHSLDSSTSSSSPCPSPRCCRARPSSPSPGGWGSPRNGGG